MDTAPAPGGAWKPPPHPPPQRSSHRAEDEVLHDLRTLGDRVETLRGRRSSAADAPAPGQTHGQGPWMVNELSDLVQLRSPAAGTTVRVHVRRP